MEVGGCPVPDDCLVDVENDVWARADGPGGAYVVGLLASHAAFAGRLLSVRFRPLEGLVERGRSVATIESGRLTGPVRLPFSGTIVERNPLLLERPKWVNDSPYDRGWFVRAVPADPNEPARTLARPEAARAALAAQIAERRIQCYPAAPDLEMIEIGSECSAILAKLDDELARRAPDDIVLLVSDDPTSPIELVRWTDRTGHTVLHHRVDGTLHRFLIRKEAHPVPRPPERGTPAEP